MGVCSKLSSCHVGNTCFALLPLEQMTGKTITEKNKIIPVIVFSFPIVVFSSPVPVFPSPVAAFAATFPAFPLLGVLRQSPVSGVISRCLYLYNNV